MNNDFDINRQTDENIPPQMTYVTYIPYGLTPETYEERKSVKKIANIIGGALLIMSAVSTTFAFLLRLILGALGLWGVEEIKNITDPAFSQFLQVVLSTAMFTLPFILLFKPNGLSVSKLVRFKRPQKNDILPFFLLGVSFCAFANITVSVMGNIFASLGIDYQVDFGERPQGVLGFMLTFIATAIVPALVEEFACRGLILGALRKYGDAFAIVCSSILFGLMHGNFQQIPFAFLVGLILGYITIKTNTIWIAVAVHCFNNAFSVVFDYLTKGLGQIEQSVIFTIYLMICLLLGIIGIYLLKNRKDAYTFKKAKISSEQKQIYKWFFASPTIIIFTVLCFIESLAFFK